MMTLNRYWTLVPWSLPELGRASRNRRLRWVRVSRRFETNQSLFIDLQGLVQTITSPFFPELALEVG